MPYQRKIDVKCSRYSDMSVCFVLDFMKDNNGQTVVMPLNVCDNSDNSDTCIKCVTRLWNYFMSDPDRIVHGSFDPLIH